MNIIYISQIIGTVSIFLLFVLNFYIAVNDKHFLRVGRVAILWTSIYVFFLFVLRLSNLLGIGTQDQLRVISGFSSLIPLLAVLSHLFLNKKIEQNSLTSP